MEIKITKKETLKKVNNDMISGFYTLVYGRLIQDNKYKKFKFVVWTEIQEICEYFDKDIITEQDKKEFLDMSISGYLESVTSDFENTKELFEFCNKTIKDYNRSV